MRKFISICLLISASVTAGCASYYFGSETKYEYRGTYSITAIDKVFRDGTTLVLHVTGFDPDSEGIQPYVVHVPLDEIHQEYITGSHLLTTPVISISHKPKDYKPHVYGNDKKIALSVDVISTGDMSVPPENSILIPVFEVPSSWFRDGLSTRAGLLKELRKGGRKDKVPAIYFGTPVSGKRYKNNTFVYVDNDFLWDGENFISLTLPAVLSERFF